MKLLRLAIWIALGGLGAGACSDKSTGSGTGDTVIVPAVQALLDGATLPKYTEAVPTFNGRRVDGRSAVTVDMVEFQQKILPEAFYASLSAPYNAGTYQWGYVVNGGSPSWPARTIEAQRGTATAVTYTNSLKKADGSPPLLARYLTTDFSVHWADPLHTTHHNG